MSRDDKKRKKERKMRNKHHRDHLLDHAVGNNHWQGSVSFQMGKDPRTKLNLNWSGVKVPVDDPTNLEGVVELTDLAKDENPTRN
jgi:hypothetical protein